MPEKLLCVIRTMSADPMHEPAMNAPLIVFGEDWGSHPTSTQHLIRRLQADRAVVWVNSIGLRQPRLNAHDLHRTFHKVIAAVRHLAAKDYQRKASDGQKPVFDILAPLALPAQSHCIPRAINRRLLRSAVQRIMRRHGLCDPILWISLPTAVDVVGNLDERGVVYYCGDDWGSLSGVDHEPVSRLETELVSKADLIFAASPVIASKFPTNKTVLLPHGVDTALFGISAPNIPSDFPNKGPVAGFYGSVAEWLDFQLLTYAAQSLPEWLFLLVGPIRTNIESLSALPNVRLLGPRNHQDLPAYVQNWDVSLLPFKNNLQIMSSNPLKLREYLAAGTPIATTDFPALDGYRDLVAIGNTPEAFLTAIRTARAEGRSRAQERLRRVAGETWEARARQVASLLANL